jgi:hypothetical protein
MPCWPSSGRHNRDLQSYRWSLGEFIRAWKADVFDRRVGLVDGEIWPVVIGGWHGDTTIRLARRLPESGVTITSATQPAGDSLPDPDCWVRKKTPPR